MTEMVGWATGGPQIYTGRGMHDSHAHLRITPQEWAAFMDDFNQTLTFCGVPAQEQSELVAIVQSTYGDIVIAPAGESQAEPVMVRSAEAHEAGIAHPPGEDHN